MEADLAGLDALEHVDQAVDVHRLVQAVVDGLADERVVGDLERAGEVLLAADLGREDGGEQVVGAHALDRRRHLAGAGAGGARRGRGRRSSASAPGTRARRASPGDGLLGVCGCHVVEDLLEREAVLRPEREDDRVVAGGGLQLEVEADAEALAQGEAPGAVDAGAEGGVDDELHAAGLVEEALEDDVLLGGDEAEGVALGAT